MSRDTPTNISRPKIDFVPPVSVSVSALIKYSISLVAPKNDAISRRYFVPHKSIDIAALTKEIDKGQNKLRNYIHDLTMEASKGFKNNSSIFNEVILH